MENLTFSPIESFVNALDTDEISVERKKELQPLVNFIQTKTGRGDEVLLNFICTHNSRRSHLAQIWAQVLAFHFGYQRVFAYSGGTEATALFPMVVETLSELGFKITNLSEGTNSVYAIKYAENAHPIIGFSKPYQHEFNPSSSFAAVMTCTQADEGCPFVFGSEIRISLPYEDPKIFDDTPQQAEKYRERSRQIAREMFYVFSKIELR
ncbi:MAG: protein-tyrosine-phosphatase [Cryomorphaceae bacterium]|nr:protein-tyrosine-phosphatase [Cryomorphaceae bacterium]